MQFENLDVWKRSARQCAEVYKFFSNQGHRVFKDQICRSALSIPCNIAEGVERDSAKEKVRFLNIAKGSAAEFITQSYIGIEAGILDRSTGLGWVREGREIAAMIAGLTNRIRAAESC
ncbi:four helix bundle protein [Marinobacterium arenosum]|uniref:four helix bundle protein n=1 Tax=Marinobacterium arenosum TaxID=2862496 RepID=UPI001C93DB40|nr:four helix bundle protein [Marinobacterium arenosum]MBY4675464.1 four helix bundle protein [Marinobacterium arenosum]